MSIGRAPMHRFATTILVLFAIGCDRPSNHLPKSLHDGQLAMTTMQQAALERDYDLYFQQFEVLRRCYIDVAMVVRNDTAQADRKESLAALQQWEAAITNARAAWANLDLPSDLAQDEALLNATQHPIQSDALQQIEKLNEEARQTHERINEKWETLESQLDDAIAAIRALRNE